MTDERISITVMLGLALGLWCIGEVRICDDGCAYAQLKRRAARTTNMEKRILPFSGLRRLRAVAVLATRQWRDCRKWTAALVRGRLYFD